MDLMKSAAENLYDINEAEMCVETGGPRTSRHQAALQNKMRIRHCNSSFGIVGHRNAEGHRCAEPADEMHKLSMCRRNRRHILIVREADGQ